jgi:hypothetical protein
MHIRYDRLAQLALESRLELQEKLREQLAKNENLERALNRAVEQARTWKQLGENANYQLRFELAKK